jgi:hypothetical protein
MRNCQLHQILAIEHFNFKEFIYDIYSFSIWIEKIADFEFDYFRKKLMNILERFLSNLHTINYDSMNG